jgi:hypothetical protein
MDDDTLNRALFAFWGEIHTRPELPQLSPIVERRLREAAQEAIAEYKLLYSHEV